jgi:hypothetical protein
MIEAKLREVKELQRFEHISLDQENVERISKSILGLRIWRETKTKTLA